MDPNQILEKLSKQHTVKYKYLQTNTNGVEDIYHHFKTNTKNSVQFLNSQIRKQGMPKLNIKNRLSTLDNFNDIHLGPMKHTALYRQTNLIIISIGKLQIHNNV